MLYTRFSGIKPQHPAAHSQLRTPNTLYIIKRHQNKNNIKNISIPSDSLRKKGPKTKAAQHQAQITNNNTVSVHLIRVAFPWRSENVDLRSLLTDKLGILNKLIDY
ncbi:hypothetical protein CUMW_205750 [Citrus unshiu]|uniref:Uncharacterized protein n=1 Tax=Citrus unshiu TaxID=55188 RepID=A0A2H5Q8P8_CITUN|nr:hypothetical protein CUMW_205750 [Citrus unshiu]GAY60912.1 hypothetical protein CUMW_205750 [Citrus unshiu]GAY60913.1 hypothetical protein CUMW_205750 [Citrus unshiu]